MEKEHLVLSDYSEEIYTTSKLISGLNLLSKVLLRCPRCGRGSTIDEAQNIPPMQCNSCRLWMESFGNALYIWEEEKMDDRDIERTSGEDAISHPDNYSIIWPSQCNCGHLYLEKYRLNKFTKEGYIGFCWCGFCRTKRMVKAYERL